MPADTDGRELPTDLGFDPDLDLDRLLRRPIEVRRGRRRSVELSLEFGRLIARVPRRMSRSEFQPMLDGMRDELEDRIRRQRVCDDEALTARARQVAARYLHDQKLGPYEVSFSRRQRKRWGSCTRAPGLSRIRISARLRGHPNWIVDHLLLHELAHLVVDHHGQDFQRLVRRSPDHLRGQGYLEALESLELLGLDDVT